MTYNYDGIILQKYCRFGNNISQLVNAIAVAEKYGVKWVSIQRLKYVFMTNPDFSSTKIGTVVVTKNPLKGSSICGKFFYPKDYPDISDVDTASILQEIGTKVLKFNNKKPFNGIHVHIRSGDIFSRGRPKKNYTLYKDADNAYISDHGWLISNMKGPDHYSQLIQIINYPMEKIVKL